MNKLPSTERTYYGVKEVSRVVQDHDDHYSRISDHRLRQINAGEQDI